MVPAPSLLNMAKTMFADLWEQKTAQALHYRDELSGKLAELDQKKSALMKRLVAASCDDVASAYEDEIARIAQEKRLLSERCEAALEPRKPFAECFHAAMGFIANPWLLWERGTFEHKRLLLRLAIPATIPFSRENGFSNPELSLPFRMLGGTDMQNLQMVPRRGLEPPRPYGHQHLKLARLPIPPPGPVWRPGHTVGARAASRKIRAPWAKAPG